MTPGDADLVNLLIRALTLEGALREADVASISALSDPAAAELVAREGAATWLHRRLRSSGAGHIEGTLPAAIRASAIQHAAAALRVDNAAVEALDALRSADIEVVLLKGLAYRAVAREYPFVDARSSFDVDLLVAESAAQGAWNALCAHGFEPAPAPAVAPPPGHHHLPGLWSAQCVTIELHTSTSRGRVPAEAWRRIRTGAQLRAWNGRQVLVPPATELLWHAVEHSCTHGADGFTLKQFLPGVALLSVSGAVDPDEVERRLSSEQLFETSKPLPVHKSVLEHWLSIASALADLRQRPRSWNGGETLLRRLLLWRLALIRRLPEHSRLYPFLLEQGTRTEMGLAGAYTTTHPALRSRAQHLAVAVLARAMYRLLRPA